jgi:hypothetical protein
MSLGAINVGLGVGVGQNGGRGVFAHRSGGGDSLRVGDSIRFVRGATMVGLGAGVGVTVGNGQNGGQGGGESVGDGD